MWVLKMIVRMARTMAIIGTKKKEINFDVSKEEEYDEFKDA